MERQGSGIYQKWSIGGVKVNGQCPVCGKFCSHIVADMSECDGIKKVSGTCKKHGNVDLTEQDWSTEEFDA